MAAAHANAASTDVLASAKRGDLAALGCLEELDVTATALGELPTSLFQLPRLRRVKADAQLLVAPAGWTVGEGALERTGGGRWGDRAKCAGALDRV